MRNARRLRFANLRTGLSAVVGTASLLLANFAQAEDCSTPVAPAPVCCDHIYEDAAQKLRNLNPGSCNTGATCQPAAPACTPAAPACNSGASLCDVDSIFDGGLLGGHGCNSGCNNGCDDGCGWCNLGDPWKLSAADGFDYGGWFEFGYQNSGDGSFTQPAAADKFNLAQFYVYATKVADGSKGVDWGFRFDATYGTDAADTQAFGNVNPGYWDFQNGFDHGIYAIALPQAYGEIAVENLSVKLGHFYTPIGYEVVTAPDNFFYSRQLTFYNSEPFTHTGALGTYKASDKLTLTGGWALGWDTGFYQYEGGNMALAGFTYAITDKVSFINQGGYGDFGWRGNGGINSSILSIAWTDKLSTVSQFDVLGTDQAADFREGSAVPGNSTGLINYAFYQINDCLKAGVRTEWYKADGTSYHTVTYGVNIKPHANVVVRPEVRNMWSPGDNRELYNQTVFGIDAIFKF